MAEWPTYSPDAAICRLLADGPLPPAAIAERLGMPVRTARHRLRQLRRDGVVEVGADGLHHLADLAGPDLADLAAPDQRILAGLARPVVPDLAGLAAPGPAQTGSGGLWEQSGTDGGWQSAVGVVAAVVTVLAVTALLRRGSTATPEPPTRFDQPVDPWWGLEW